MKTLSLIEKVMPIEVLVPNTLISPLIDKINKKTIPRSYFDQTIGFNIYRKRANK